MPRSLWERAGSFDDIFGMAKHFDRVGFDRDAWYFVSYETHHPGSESWPDHVTSCAFSNNESSTKTVSEFMSDFIPKQVRLTGLRGAAHLNGQEGVVINGGPPNSARACVELNSGEEVSVKHENYERIFPGA
mmetsp:Transcript_11280/g.27479  ORF Transcript_11280/g.27479 Transcript_11280/m.27479 type:complete len:132 (-) Transcript_11280:507-902(-)